MDTQTTTTITGLNYLTDPQSLARELTEEHGATHGDLNSLGVSDYTARKVLKEYTPRPLDADEYHPTPLMSPESKPVCAVVPANSLGRAYLAKRAYLRDSELGQPIRLTATHLATNDGDQIREVFPITARYRLGSANALAHLSSPIARAVHAMPQTVATWDSPLVYLELGTPIPLGLPLGYNKTGVGTRSGIVRVLHYDLATLQALAAAPNGVLRGAPTV